MNRHLLLLTLVQGLFLTNNVTFIAINGLVGLQLAPFGWMATLPVMGYVVGGALASPSTMGGKRDTSQSCSASNTGALSSSLNSSW